LNCDSDVEKVICLLVVAENKTFFGWKSLPSRSRASYEVRIFPEMRVGLPGGGCENSILSDWWMTRTPQALCVCTYYTDVSLAIVWEKGIMIITSVSLPVILDFWK